jgi:PAS domain S-box-containing protein
LSDGKRGAHSPEASTALMFNPMHRTWSVRWYLIVLALCCTIPIAVVAGLFALHLVQDAVERERSLVTSRLYLLRDAVDQRIEASVRVLQSLATSPALRNGDFEGFRRSASETAQSFGALTIVLSDVTGRQLVNTRAALGQAVASRAHLETQERVLATGEPQVSDLYPATIDQRPVMTVEVPVRIDGEIRYVLSMGLEPQYLSALMKDYVPNGFIGAIIDRNGILVARQAATNGSELVGRPTIPEVRSHLAQPETFWIEAVSRDGTPTFTSILRSSKTGWAINLAVPRSLIERPFRQATLFTVAIAVIGLLIGLVLARLVARKLTSSAALLERAANNIGSEQQVTPVPSHVREYDSALAAFASASAKIKLRADERDRALSALRESEVRWRLIAETLPNLVWTDLPDGQCDWLSSQWGKYTGIPEQELLGLNWLNRVIHPDDRERTLACWQAACDGRADYDLEYRIRRYDGEYRWFKTRGVPLRDASGKIVYWFGTCTDIEDIRSAEKREQVLMREVNHRAKNMLALVQAIARQTVFSNPKDFIARFDARLQALAVSQDLLVKSGWKEIPLETLIRTQLAHFADILDVRIRLSGPALHLTAAAAQTIGIILHELSTNASKYGALSTDVGEVNISWHVGQLNGGDPQVVLIWTEQGGPPVPAPTRSGFGTTVLGNFAKMSLKATTVLEYASSGLIWKLTCPVNQLVDVQPESQVSTSSNPDEQARSPLNRNRILVVEDEAMAAMDVVRLLTDEGFEVVGPASSVLEAFQLLQARSACDAALIDVNLGTETSEPIAWKLLAAGTPFIAMSGYARDQLPSAFANIPFVPKPLQRKQLLDEITRCLSRKNP